jgi:hypothetical protein
MILERMDKRKTAGANFARLRKAKGLTLEHVAELSGFGQNYISWLESVGSMPTARTTLFTGPDKFTVGGQEPASCGSDGSACRLLPATTSGSRGDERAPTPARHERCILDQASHSRLHIVAVPGPSAVHGFRPKQDGRDLARRHADAAGVMDAQQLDLALHPRFHEGQGRRERTCSQQKFKSAERLRRTAHGAKIGAIDEETHGASIDGVADEVEADPSGVFYNCDVQDTALPLDLIDPRVCVSKIDT